MSRSRPKRASRAAMSASSSFLNWTVRHELAAVTVDLEHTLEISPRRTAAHLGRRQRRLGARHHARIELLVDQFDDDAVGADLGADQRQVDRRATGDRRGGHSMAIA